ncbi:hypothetical protein AGR7A_pAt10066 [Agrobacterium deltaense NCPPB 1641]|uniref:Uncharacterized protein n=1 Tax=Agrobacterium deltaense NCPPB 1641 TaxID=1183425 RepID=A0A1S7U728_9HYPH|nr:hypothetical protein AGR7A_pAt10066 [Agrobacterium deltaense NCPPB 1641]
MAAGVRRDERGRVRLEALGRAVLYRTRFGNGGEPQPGHLTKAAGFKRWPSSYISLTCCKNQISATSQKSNAKPEIN